MPHVLSKLAAADKKRSAVVLAPRRQRSVNTELPRASPRSGIGVGAGARAGAGASAGAGTAAKGADVGACAGVTAGLASPLAGAAGAGVAPPPFLSGKSVDAGAAAGTVPLARILFVRGLASSNSSAANLIGSVLALAFRRRRCRQRCLHLRLLGGMTRPLSHVIGSAD